MIKRIIIACMLLTACAHNRNNLSHYSYNIQNQILDQNINCFIRQANDDIDAGDAIRVNRLEDPHEVRVARVATTYTENLMWEADFIRTEYNKYKLRLITFSLARDRVMRVYIKPELDKCGIIINN